MVLTCFPSIAISVCDYYLHDMCQEFAVPNCVESSTYDPAKGLTEASKSITHHFQVCTLYSIARTLWSRKVTSRNLGLLFQLDILYRDRLIYVS